MSNIHNFTNRHLCEYQSIFPTVASLLDQLLFTIGNGYEFKNGMIIDRNGTRIDEFPAMTEDTWIALLEECYLKEVAFSKRFSHDDTVDEERVAAEYAKYKRQDINESMFTEESLLSDLRFMHVQRIAEKSRWNTEPSYIRPYPLSLKYSYIFALNKKTPVWFLQIALNLCKAWVRFLTNEIETNNVWIKPSLRPKVEADKEQVAFLNELLLSLGANLDTKYKEPETDYADLSWTTKHRDILAEQVTRIENLIGENNG